jgi:protein involved in polysaccharide export with SLBB domain
MEKIFVLAGYYRLLYCGRLRVAAKTYYMKINRFILTPIFLALVLCACSTTPEEQMGPQVMEGALEAEPIADYRLRPGDEIQVKFFYHPELNETMRVGPDGKISLELIDELLVAGLTRSQLDGLLTQEYDRYLENFSISIIVREYSGLKVYVGGEVNQPQYLSLQGNMSILQSIVEAQGFSRFAEKRSVVLIRKGPANRPKAMTIDLESVIDGTQLENDIYLKPSDIVYVPKTWIGKANKFVDQYIRGLFFFDTVMQGVGYALGYNWVND